MGLVTCPGLPSQGDLAMATPDPETDLLRQMTPARKLAVMNALIRQAYELKAASLRDRFPEMPEAEVWARTRATVGGDCP